MSKLSLEQIAEISSLRVRQPDVDSETLAHLWADGIFNGRSLDVRNLVKAIRLMGPVAIDRGGQMWFYKHGVWMPDGKRELTRRVELSTAGRYRKDHVAQAESLIQAMPPQILGLGPKNLINVKNGMLNWETLELLPHDPAYFSTYQLRVPWNSEATCPSVEKWFDETFDRTLHEVLWQVVGVLINVSSAATLHPPGPLNSAYGTAKVALNQFTRHLAAEVEGTGVTANVIHPGDLKTEMWSDIRDQAERLGSTAAAYSAWAEWVDETGGDPIEKSADLVLELLNEQPPRNGEFCWIRDPLQAPIKSWGSPGEAQPWL